MTAAAAPASLAWLQNQLELTYELQVPHRVDDYLITDRRVADRLARSTSDDVPPRSPETLYIVEEDPNVDIGLFVDEDVIASLSRDHPTDRLHAGNLADFCVALEGVSHFLYVVWNAGHRRSISQLELELQAEIDKFVMSAVLFSRQRGDVPAALGSWLFDAPEFHVGLSAESLNRYEAANHYAGKYCRRLERRFLRANQGSGLIKELRRFYRLPQREKIRRIEQIA